jgi:dihydrolipoamide dehydrogenase
MKTHYDVIVIGAGPAGYVAAIRCAQLGLETVCVDKWVDTKQNPKLGGTCLNVGCIPSKALLESSENYYKSTQELGQHGISFKEVSLDLTQMMERKNRIINTLTLGIQSLFKTHHIDWIQGKATLSSDKNVHVLKHGDKKPSLTISGSSIIIATGSSSINLPNAELDNQYIVDSTGALEFTQVPEKLGIIGAGVIGLELGSVWNRLGSEVVIFEAQDNFLAFTDQLIAKESLKQFTRQSLDIQLNTRLMSATVKNKKVAVQVKKDEQELSQTFDKLIIAVGRHPNSGGLVLDDTELVIDEQGFFHVNEHCETSLPGVYAIGDVVRGPMLAHKGSEEGIMVAERIAGHFHEVNYQLIPSVIYTEPELAWVGKTEQELKTAGVDYTTGSFPFAASGRAQAAGETAGMVKVISHAVTDRILGVHILGAHASEMIAQAVIAMELGASAEDIGLTTFAHPTFSEAFHEAALAVNGKAIHIAQKKRR